ncbi:izumo sperm-egg fusion protein 2 isoform X5 [Dermochelys coriacea]|uniref:izumo sperm-egg fusion protein 2 isoform X5 n=1 Tax=Dermochelys coriacea TaxID=27794 RepID=UPI0018E76115|nr:izumo sperm-egg fusion protein 2 isoform X5 [Dermochelys coriacea]
MVLLVPLMLGAWLAVGAGGCLQCDRQIRSTLESLRTGLVPRQIRDSRLQARAQALLRGMEGGFFRHYATSQFAGTAALSSINALIHRVRLTAAGLERSALTDQALLDALVAYRRRTTMELKSALKEHQAKACNPKTCGWLYYDVFDCTNCRKAKAVCLKQHHCLVDSQARLSLRYRPPAPGPPIARTGVSVVLCMGALLFLALSVAAVTYWRNQQSLRQ